MKFERVAKYPDAIIPTRATKQAAGYDFYAAEDITIPSYWQMMQELDKVNLMQTNFLEAMLGAEELKFKYNDITDALKDEHYKDYRPTLVSTGVKVQLDPDKYLQISARSSLPRKNWLIVANAPGIVDADYYNNPSNEGELFVQIINLAPFPFIIKKGEKFAQGVILQYFTVDEEEEIITERTGGFGSTGTK